MYNDESDIDQAVDSLIRITKGDYKGRYVANKGDYFPVDWSPDYFDKYVDIARIVEGSCKDEEFKLHSKQKSKEKIYIKETVHAVSCNSSTETISVKYESNQYLSSLLGYF